MGHAWGIDYAADNVAGLWVNRKQIALNGVKVMYGRPSTQMTQEGERDR